jgi:hypothetical protein
MGQMGQMGRMLKGLKSFCGFPSVILGLVGRIYQVKEYSQKYIIDKIPL